MRPTKQYLFSEFTVLSTLLLDPQYERALLLIQELATPPDCPRRLPFLGFSYLSIMIDSKSIVWDSSWMAGQKVKLIACSTTSSIDEKFKFLNYFNQAWPFYKNLKNTRFLIQYLYMTSLLYIRHGIYRRFSCRVSCKS